MSNVIKKLTYIGIRPGTGTWTGSDVRRLQATEIKYLRTIEKWKWNYDIRQNMKAWTQQKEW